jgi:hypothetical protein
MRRLPLSRVPHLDVQEHLGYQHLLHLPYILHFLHRALVLLVEVMSFLRCPHYRLDPVLQQRTSSHLPPSIHRSLQMLQLHRPLKICTHLFPINTVSTSWRLRPSTTSRTRNTRAVSKYNHHTFNTFTYLIWSDHLPFPHTSRTVSAGASSELRCSLPLLILDTRLLESARASTLETHRLLLGAQEGDDDA